jgi:hypothetical protein
MRIGCLPIGNTCFLDVPFKLKTTCETIQPAFNHDAFSKKIVCVILFYPYSFTAPIAILVNLTLIFIEITVKDRNIVPGFSI